MGCSTDFLDFRLELVEQSAIRGEILKADFKGGGLLAPNTEGTHSFSQLFLVSINSH